MKRFFIGILLISSLALAAPKIQDADIKTNAAIQLSKLAALNNNSVVVTNGSGVLTNSALSASQLSGLAAYTPGGILFGSVSGLPGQDNSNIFYDMTNFRLGLLTNTPSTTIGLGGAAARTIAMERATSGAGNNLTLQSGGVTSATMDTNGGTLSLASGISTGLGTSLINFMTASSAVSGTSDNTPATRVTINGNGSVGIGFVNPAATLSVSGTSTITGATGKGILALGTSAANNPSIAIGIFNAFGNTTGAAQIGISNTLNADSTASGNQIGMNSKVNIDTAAVSAAIAYAAGVPALTNGAAITTSIGLSVPATSVATNNRGIQSAIAAGGAGITNYNVFANGTAQNYFTGSVAIGNTPVPGAALEISTNITGAPSTIVGNTVNIKSGTFTDNVTAGSGTAAGYNVMTLNLPTLAAANTGVITTNAVNLNIRGAIVPGANQSITNSKGMQIVTANVTSNTTNSYALTVAAMTGALNNYAASFTGGSVGILTVAPGSSLHVAGSYQGIVNALSSNTTIDATYQFITVNALASGVNITLPPCVASIIGRIYHAKKTDVSINPVNYVGGGSDTIDGAASVANVTQYRALSVVCTSAGAWSLF